MDPPRGYVKGMTDLGMQNATLDQLKVLVKKHSQQGLDYRVYCWNPEDDNARKYLLGPDFEAPRSHYMRGIELEESR